MTLAFKHGVATLDGGSTKSTPPCSEVVNWVVLTEAIAVSQAQVDAFAALYPINARPVQPLYRRFILTR